MPFGLLCLREANDDVQALDYQLLVEGDILQRLADIADSSAAWPQDSVRLLQLEPRICSLATVPASLARVRHAPLNGIQNQTPLHFCSGADSMRALAQLDDNCNQTWFWAAVLSRELHRMAAAADPVSPWLAQEAATNKPLLKGLQRGTHSVAKVLREPWPYHHSVPGLSMTNLTRRFMTSTTLPMASALVAA